MNNENKVFVFFIEVILQVFNRGMNRSERLRIYMEITVKYEIYE